MKKNTFVTILVSLCMILLLLVLSLSVACGEAEPEETTPATTTPAATTPAATTPAATTPAATTPAGELPQYGGKLTIITRSTPGNVGYMPKQSFADSMSSFFFSERMFALNVDGSLDMILCESYEVSENLQTITLHLRKGIKFYDGTDWNADACVWNLKACLETGALGGSRYITDIVATDSYTVTVTLNASFNQIIYNLWRIYMYSPTATQANGEEWAVTNSVSTGPYHVTEFLQGSYIKMVKQENYWRTGLPYIDEIELVSVLEPATCSAMMQSGQAQIWGSASSQEAAELKATGDFEIAVVPTTYDVIYPDSTNPESPFANKKVREAIEHAIDRQAYSDALGFGFMIPVFQPTHEGTQGYNPDYPVREYDPNKAKQLMTEAGYPTGIKTTIICQQTGRDAAVVIKNYLAEIGIDIEVDVADTGRFWGAVNGGWEGLLLGPLAVNPQYCVAWLDHVGPMPLMKFASMAKSQKYLDICAKVVTAPDVPTMENLTMDMVTQAGLDCMFIPLAAHLGARVNTPKLHTNYCIDYDWTDWSIWNDWLE